MSASSLGPLQNAFLDTLIKRCVTLYMSCKYLCLYKCTRIIHVFFFSVNSQLLENHMTRYMIRTTKLECNHFRTDRYIPQTYLKVSQLFFFWSFPIKLWNKYYCFSVKYALKKMVIMCKTVLLIRHSGNWGHSRWLKYLHHWWPYSHHQQIEKCHHAIWIVIEVKK